VVTLAARYLLRVVVNAVAKSFHVSRLVVIEIHIAGRDGHVEVRLVPRNDLGHRGPLHQIPTRGYDRRREARAPWHRPHISSKLTETIQVFDNCVPLLAPWTTRITSGNDANETLCAEGLVEFQESVR